MLRGNDLRAGQRADRHRRHERHRRRRAADAEGAGAQSCASIGEVNTVRGSYTFQGRRFEIMRDGRIRFSGTDEIDPLLDLRRAAIISGVETFVRVRGTMRRRSCRSAATRRSTRRTSCR